MRMSGSASRWLVSALTAVGLSLLVVLGSGAGAAAQGVTVLGGITDPGNVLGACRQQVLDAEAGLFDATGSNVYAVLIPDTGGADLADVVSATWDDNQQLTTKDVLFVATTDEPHAQTLQGTDVDQKVTQNEQDAITESMRTPALKGDWCAATLAVVNGYRSAIGGGSLTDNGGNGGGGGGGGIPWWVWLFLLAVVLAIGVFLWRRRGSASMTERAAQEDLGKQASSLLLQTDDALRNADQEVGYAEAQFGEAQAAPYRTALDSAKGLLREAFTLSQQLDDETPETPDQRHAMLQQVIDKCTQARKLVDDQAARVKELRDLDKNIDQVLPQTAGLVDAQAARVEPARVVLTTLAGHYQPANFQAVKGNADAAEQKLAGARTALAAAQAALTAGTRDVAVAKAQEGETAIHEATALLDAVDQTRDQLAKGESDLQASISAVDQDVTAARAAIQAGRGVERSAEVESAAALLAKARELASAQPVDLVGATRAATDANTAIDAVAAGIQAADAQAQRNAAAAQAAIANATASVSQAQGLIAGYGASAAGRRASTRLAEAQQYLTRAQSVLATDPATAAQAAQTADALADEAIAEMQASGVGGQVQWGQSAGGGGFGGIGGYGVPQAPRTGGGDLMGSILGGILGGMMSGGGSSQRSGWSGGGGGFGGFGSGGFGGGSRSSGRSSGFGGGSRSSSGGGGHRGGAGRRSGF
jgi:hypothetical protein